MAALDSANLICSKIHDVVRTSGINFSMNQTPYSSYIRRKFIEGEEPCLRENHEEVSWKIKVEDLEKKCLELICVNKDEKNLYCEK